MKKYVFVFIFLMIYVYTVFAEMPTRSLPEYNTDAVAFFQRETGLFALFVNENPEALAFKNYLSFLYNFSYIWGTPKEGLLNGHGPMGLDFQYTRIIPLNQYFYVPLFGAMCPATETDKIQGNEIFTLQWSMLLGSGLLFQSDFGTIAGYAGWNYHIIQRATADSRYTTDIASEYLKNENNLYFSIVPIVNTGKYPLIGLILKSIELNFGFNQNGMSDDFMIKPVSTRINFEEFSIESIILMYKRENAGILAMREIYELEFSIKINNNSLYLLGGYQRYYDFMENSIIYENTPYFGLQYLVDGIIGPIFYIDKMHLPKIGFVFKISVLGAFMETAFIRRFVYNAGGRTVW
jgi:hypothetical protein